MMTTTRAQTRYKTTWLGLTEPEDPDHMRVVQVLGTAEEVVLARCPKVRVAGDAMMAEMLSGRAPVLVLDAPNDPRTNKAIVAALGNRTILNVPLALGPMPIGTLGMGSFDDEGVMAPTRDELDALVVFATQLAGALTRMRLIDQQRHDAEVRIRIERQLESLQRLELMGVLTAGVAHDLNNLLAAVQMSLDSMHPLGEDVEALDDARHATQSAHQVTQQLLTLGKGRPSALQPVDLNARVSSTLKLVRASIPRDVHVTHNAGHPPPVHGDPVQIDQVVANLVINARDAVGKQGRIDIETGDRELSREFARVNPWAREGRYSWLRVGDSGPGIPEELLARIWDPLFSTKATGTGLGLAVVSQVVQRHQGLIHCQSVTGQGTSFDVYFPAS